MENASQVPTTAPEPSLQDGLDAASEQFPDAQPWGRVGGSAYNISPPQGEVGKLGNEIWFSIVPCLGGFRIKAPL